MGETPEDETGETGDLPRDLRFLKALVTVLTGVMIAGVITITTLLVIRLNGAGDGPAVARIAPGDFALPDGIGVLGISVVGDQTVIVGDDGVIRVFDTASRVEVQAFTLDP